MIVLKKICKSFADKKVLNNISLHIAPGESVGIIGLNGAGKTTLLNIIAGTLNPDNGFIRVNGAKQLIADKKALKDVAYVSGTKSQLWNDLPVKSSYDNLMVMYGSNPEEYNKTFLKMDEILNVSELMNATPKELSLGEKMRCELMYAMLINPKILMLDEAMIGLDVTVKHKMVKYLEEMKGSRTLIYTSHNLLEVEKICDRIILLDNGKVIYDGAVKSIIKEFSPLHKIELEIDGEIPDFMDIPIAKYSLTNNLLSIEYDREIVETAQIVKHIMKKNAINNFRFIEPDLEDTIKKIYERML